MKSREIKKYLEANDNGNKIYQNLWDIAKAVLRGKFIEINTYIKIKKTYEQPNITPQRTRKRRTKPKL